MGFISTVVVIIIIFVVIKLYVNKLRHDYLVNQYRSNIGKSLYDKNIWQGMTVEMLIDGLGKPADIDEKVLKTKTKRIYKFGQIGKNRFKTKIIVENNIVVGWDLK